MLIYNYQKIIGGEIMGIDVILTLIFVVLKLTKLISWSWIWVLSPLWISVILVIISTIGEILMTGDDE